MRISQLLDLAGFTLGTLLFRRARPLAGTIIITDTGNLSCRHCAVSNLVGFSAPYTEVRDEMRRFRQEGVRILFFSGGEPALWRGDCRTVNGLCREAKEMGFTLVNVATNGTVTLDLPDADMLFLSIDGTRGTHDAIRGESYDAIMENLGRTQNRNICVYAAINRYNCGEVRYLAELARDHPKLTSVSYNLHTPYPGTEDACLTAERRGRVVAAIRQAIRDGLPVFNIEAGLDAHLRNDWKRPSPHCIVSERGKRSICGRCQGIPGLCERCGYLFPAEFALLFGGNAGAMWQVARTYARYV